MRSSSNSAANETQARRMAQHGVDSEAHRLVITTYNATKANATSSTQPSTRGTTVLQERRAAMDEISDGQCAEVKTSHSPPEADFPRATHTACRKPNRAPSVVSRTTSSAGSL